MDKRQLIFLGVGIGLAAAAVAMMSLQRSLERDEQGAPGWDLQPIRPPETEAESQPRLLGAFRLVPEGDLTLLVGPGEQLLAEIYPGADVRLAGTLDGADVALVVEKDCEDPCNPRSRLFVAGRPSELFAVDGMVRLQDLDRDGRPELLLEHLLVQTEEVVTLPLRLEEGRFVNAYRRFPDGVDRQVSNLGRAAETACSRELDGVCCGLLDAIVTLALFRGDGPRAAALASLELPAEARTYAEGQRPRLEAMLESLLPG